MRRLKKWFSNWLEARREDARMARVHHELRIKRELEWVEGRRDENQTAKVLTVSTPELMGQSIMNQQNPF